MTGTKASAAGSEHNPDALVDLNSPIHLPSPPLLLPDIDDERLTAPTSSGHMIPVGKNHVDVDSYRNVIDIIRLHFCKTDDASQEVLMSDVDEVIRQNTPGGRAPKQGVTHSLLTHVFGFKCVQPNWCNHCQCRALVNVCAKTVRCKRNRRWVVLRMRRTYFPQCAR